MPKEKTIPLYIRIAARLGALALAGAIIGWATWVLLRAFGAVSLADIVSALEHQRHSGILLSLILTGVSFTALSLYDVIAARIIAPFRISVWASALAGAIGNAISNTLGFHAVTGSVVRYRIYSRCGLDLGDVARIIALSWTALGLGFLTMFAITTLLFPGSDRLRLSAIVAGALLAALLAWLFTGKRRIQLGSHSLELPSGQLATLQMMLGGIEMAAAIGALYVLLPSENLPSFAAFSIACISAILLGIVSHAPGGIGVFEAAILTLLPAASKSDVLAALLLYRLIYNILPFVLGALALGLFELLHARASSRADSS